MAEDILGGLKNALERGASLEEAIRSFINAGYREAEVRQAAAQLSSGALSNVSSNSSYARPQPAVKQILPQRPPFPATKPWPVQISSRQNPQPQVIANHGSHKPFGMGAVILLALILIILIAALLGTIFFKDQIISFIQNLF